MEHELQTQNESEILHFLADAGCCMLSSGADVMRTQQTLQMMAQHLGCMRWNVYVIANGVFLSTANGVGEVRHVASVSPHFGKIAAVNALSRDLATHQYDLQTATQRLGEIVQMQAYSAVVTILATGLGAGGFCALFGSSVQDAYCALFIGCLLGIFQQLASARISHKLMFHLCSAMVVGVLGIVLVQLHLGENLHQILIGSVFPLVPGWLITSAVRDVTNGDYISSIIHLFDALLIAGSVALGVGAVLLLSQMMWGMTV